MRRRIIYTFRYLFLGSSLTYLWFVIFQNFFDNETLDFQKEITNFKYIQVELEKFSKQIRKGEITLR